MSCLTPTSENAFIGSESFINESDSKMLSYDFNRVFVETEHFWYSL